MFSVTACYRERDTAVSHLPKVLQGMNNLSGMSHKNPEQHLKPWSYLPWLVFLTETGNFFAFSGSGGEMLHF